VAVKVPQPEVHIRGDGDARHEFVGKVVMSCERAGIFKIGFITESPPCGSTPLTHPRVFRPEKGRHRRRIAAAFPDSTLSSTVSGMSTPRDGPLDFLSENDCGVCHRVTAIGIGMMPMLNTYYASLAGAPGMNRIGSQ